MLRLSCTNRILTACGYSAAKPDKTGCILSSSGVHAPEPTDYRSAAQWLPAGHRNRAFHTHNVLYGLVQFASLTVRFGRQSESKVVHRSTLPDSPDHRAKHTAPKSVPSVPKNGYPVCQYTRFVSDVALARFFENVSHLRVGKMFKIPKLDRFIRQKSQTPAGISFGWFATS